MILVAVMLYFTDYHRVLNSLTAIKANVVIWVCLLQFVTIGLINFQWFKIANYMGIQSSFRQIFHINMSGTFVESITPSVKAGGEGVKIYLLKSLPTSSLSKATAMVCLQKMVSMLAFFMLNIAGMIWFFCTAELRFSYVNILMISVIFLGIVTFLLIVVVMFPTKLKRFTKILPTKFDIRHKVEQGISSLQQALESVKGQYHLFWYQFMVSTAIWGLFAVKAYIIARGLQMQSSFISIAVVTYFAYMIGMVPLTPGSIGTFEGSVLLLLTPMGILSHQAMAFALTLRFVTFWFVFGVSSICVGYVQIRKVNSIKWKGKDLNEKYSKENHL